MASDIYNIPSWNVSTSYGVNDVVLRNNQYYYCLQNHVSSSFDSDLYQGRWNGVISVNDKQYPYFFWRPSYNYNIPIKAKTKSIVFGDGYSQDVKDGINNILLTINLNFEERTFEEYSAISHFLYARGGYERFYFIPPQPYGVLKRFICKEWDASQSFVDNYNIKATFEERVL